MCTSLEQTEVSIDVLREDSSRSRVVACFQLPLLRFATRLGINKYKHLAKLTSEIVKCRVGEGRSQLFLTHGLFFCGCGASCPTLYVCAVQAFLSVIVVHDPWA